MKVVVVVCSVILCSLCSRYIYFRVWLTLSSTRPCLSSTVTSEPQWWPRHTQPWPAMIEPGSPAAAGEEQSVGDNSLDLAPSIAQQLRMNNECSWCFPPLENCSAGVSTIIKNQFLTVAIYLGLGPGQSHSAWPPVSNIKTNYSFKINFIATDFSILVNLCFCSLQVFGKRQLEQFTLFPWVVINETLVNNFGDIKNLQLWVIEGNRTKKLISRCDRSTDLFASRSYSENCENSCREM